MGCSQSINKDVINSIQAAAVPTADVAVSEKCKRETIMLKDIVSDKDNNAFNGKSGLSAKYDDIYSDRMENILGQSLIVFISIVTINLTKTYNSHRRRSIQCPRHCLHTVFRSF